MGIQLVDVPSILDNNFLRTLSLRGDGRARILSQVVQRPHVTAMAWKLKDSCSTSPLACYVDSLAGHIPQVNILAYSITLNFISYTVHIYSYMPSPTYGGR